MPDKRKLTFWIVAATMLSILSSECFSQEKDKTAAISKIEASDTIDYVPSWYTGALNYNLMIASAKGLVTEIDRLIELGANVNAYNENGATPLIFAVTNNKPESVRALLKHSPHLDDITSNSESALLIAVKDNYTEIAEILIRAGAEIDFTDYYGNTPLHYASLYGYLDMADILLYYDAPVDEKSDEGITPLHAATWAGNIDIADLLIQNGANMEARDKEGYTPFLIAASFGDTIFMDMFYKFGVDIFTRNIYNHNALTLATAFGHKEAVKYLLEKSNRWQAADSLGYDPYKIASKYRRKEIIGILEKYNIPGKAKHGFDQVALSGSAKFAKHDFYTGISASFKEPYLNAGITGGIDMKLWYSRILIEENENYYYQYYNKESMIYAGLFKDLDLTHRIDRSNFIISGSLLGGYNFGNKFRGTDKAPASSFKLIPSVSLKWTINALTIFTSAEYIESEYYKIGPMWFRIGASYNYFFDNMRPRLKKIKWI